MVPGMRTEKDDGHLPLYEQYQLQEHQPHEAGDLNSVAILDCHDALKIFKAALILEGMTCSPCVGVISKALTSKPWVQAADVSLITQTANVTFYADDIDGGIAELVAAVQSTGYGAAIDSVVEASADKGSAEAVTEDLWKAVFTVVGMTCSSCVGKITRSLKNLSFVKEADVNLINNSATVTFYGNERLKSMTSAVERSGYFATLVDLSNQTEGEFRRKISISVSGMHFERCPTRVRDALHGIEDIALTKPLSVGDPVIALEYSPDPPRLSVRTILETIAAVDDSFIASIYHSMTPEERSHQLMAREQRQILLRVILSVAAAIPTLIIGVIYMNLVPEDDLGYQLLMTERLGVSLGEWASFAIATPVYSFAADVFHRRTLKELLTMWRPKSSVPVLPQVLSFRQHELAYQPWNHDRLFRIPLPNSS